MSIPGATLADARGDHRIRKLEESRLNCWIMMLQLQDQVDCMTHEIEQIKKGST